MFGVRSQVPQYPIATWSQLAFPDASKIRILIGISTVISIASDFRNSEEQKQKVYMLILIHFNKYGEMKYFVQQVSVLSFKGTVSTAQNRLKVVLLDRSWLGHPSL